MYTFSKLLVYLVIAQPHSQSLTFPYPSSLPGGGKMKDTHNEAGNCPDLYAPGKAHKFTYTSDTIAKISIKVPPRSFLHSTDGLKSWVFW